LEKEFKRKEELNSKVGDNQDTINNLLEDISQIQIVNKEKQILLETITNEKEIMKEKFAELEKERVDLKEKLETKECEKDESKSLSEELGICDPRSQNVSVECDSCDKDFETVLSEKTRKEHYHDSSIKKIFGWKIKEIELKKK
jgi:chromosome segregation ATPase